MDHHVGLGQSLSSLLSSLLVLQVILDRTGSLLEPMVRRPGLVRAGVEDDGHGGGSGGRRRGLAHLLLGSLLLRHLLLDDRLDVQSSVSSLLFGSTFGSAALGLFSKLPDLLLHPLLALLLGLLGVGGAVERIHRPGARFRRRLQNTRFLLLE